MIYLAFSSVTSHIYYSVTENSGFSRLFTSDPFGEMYLGAQLLNLTGLEKNLMVGMVS